MLAAVYSSTFRPWRDAVRAAKRLADKEGHFFYVDVHPHRRDEDGRRAWAIWRLATEDEAREIQRRVRGVTFHSPQEFRMQTKVEFDEAPETRRDSRRRRRRRDSADRPIHDRPCAAPGLQSYRAKGPYGWIMIGAKDDREALREAKRSTPNPTDLQRWDGLKYVPITIPTRGRRRSRDAQEPLWIVVDTERRDRVVGRHRSRVDARNDAAERNRAARSMRFAYMPEYAQEYALGGF